MFQGPVTRGLQGKYRAKCHREPSFLIRRLFTKTLFFGILVQFIPESRSKTLWFERDFVLRIPASSGKMSP